MGVWNSNAQFPSQNLARLLRIRRKSCPRLRLRSVLSERIQDQVQFSRQAAENSLRFFSIADGNSSRRGQVRRGRIASSVERWRGFLRILYGHRIQYRRPTDFGGAGCSILGFITASRSGQCQVANSLEYFTPLNLSTEGFGFSSSRRNFLNTGIFQTKLNLWLGCWRFCNENLITVHSHLLKFMRLVRFLRAFINGNWCALQHATPFEIVGNVLCKKILWRTAFVIFICIYIS